MVLTIRSGSMPCPGRLVAAVGLPLHLAGGVGVGVDREAQPQSRASVSRSSGGSWRSGRQLISSAVSNCAHAANTTRRRTVDGGRPRPDQLAPGAVAEDVDVGAGDRRAPCAGSSPRAPCAAWSGRWPRPRRARASSSSAWSRAPSARMSTSMPVRMRNGASCSLSRPPRRAGPQPLGGQPVGHGEAGGVVGQDHVLVAEGDGGAGHLLDRRPAVGPGRVGVAVAPQRGPQLGALAERR